MSVLDNILKMLFGNGSHAAATSSSQAPEAETESLLHIGWQQRDEGIYPDLFGPAKGEPVLLDEDIFRKDFGRRRIHPFWLHHGVLTFPPTSERPTWLYATSGMSNAFDSMIEEWSGLGVEFILETPSRADWAADKLARLMAYNLLIAIGHYENVADLMPGSIVRLGVPVNGDEACCLRNLIVLDAETPTSRNPETSLSPESAQLDAQCVAHSSSEDKTPTTATYKLVTGRFELLQIVAISDSEADFAEDKGHQALAAKLRDARHFPAIDVSRAPVV